MKIIGRMATKYKKGFTEELNSFFQLITAFRKNNTFLPRGIFRFKSFEEAEKWRYKMMRGKYPDPQQ
ncbi:MAG: hypothetical protein ABIJ30_02195 [bacterium]